METKQTLIKLRDSILRKFDDLTEVLKAVDRLIQANYIEINKEPATRKSKSPENPVKKTKETKQTNASGKMMFSKYMLEIFKNNPQKEYSLMELGNELNEAVAKGIVSPVSGIVKDEVSKRLYQFVKRGDAFRTISGTYQFNPNRHKSLQ